MYKSATRVNPAFIKRLNKQAVCPYRVFPPRRESVSTKGINVPHGFGIRGQGWFTGHHSKHFKKLYPLDIQSLLVHVQRKWVVRSSKLLEDGVSNAPSIRLARMFSGKSNAKENVEKKNSTSLGSGQNKDEKETGCTSRKPSKKLLSEARASSQKDQSSEANNAQRHEHLNSKDTVSEKRKRKPTKLAVNRGVNKFSEGMKIPVEMSSPKNIEDFDRLQLLKGKLIRRLGEKWLPWETIRDTFDNFPYYINENTRDLLLDCIAARLKKHDFSMYGECLPSASHMILLQGQPGTELYQEALVKAIAHHLQVSLLVVDSNTLSAKGLKDDAHIAGSSMEEQSNDNDEKHSANEILHAENKVNMEAIGLSRLDRVNQMFGSPVKILHLKNPRRFDIPWKVLRFPAKKEDRKGLTKLIQVDDKNWADELKNLVVTGREDELKKLGKHGEELKKLWHDLIIGDHVRYRGPKAAKGKASKKVSIGQEGFVSSISDGLPWKVCVKFQGDSEEVFCDAAELEKVDSSASDEAWLARFPELPIEALCKMVLYRGPVIVHFPDIQQWFSGAPTSKGRALLLKKVKDMLTKVDGPVAFIASRIKEDSSAPAAASTGLESMLPPFFFEAIKPAPASEADEDMDGVFRMFKNVINVSPPEEPQLLRIWQKQLEEDKKIAKQTRNHMLLNESLEKNHMSCSELLDINTCDLQLTSDSAEDVIGWARNMMFHSDQIHTSEGRLSVGKIWLQKSLMRFKALKVANEDRMSYIAELAENEYEKSFVSSVVLAHEIGVKFNEIGALDDVKSTLKELIVLPLQRPELFRKGNLRKPCKGVLLFGPPGTGKTLVAKAVATEAGANFINVSASSITSKFYGDDEKLVRALFALARKLSPVVIFVDEVDSLLGARGGSSEHEAMRRIKNEFMAAWDGLQSKESEQILVFATTNRPFDLDDAVIRRLPRRLLVDLPNVENRAKILRIILANEDLDDTFSYESLAAQTEGYSGSDLKNLCVAAAYTPVRELLEAEEQVKASNEATNNLSQKGLAVRPLCLNDFLQAKSKIGASLAFDAMSMIQLRQWNEQYGE
eukprot:c21930_g1_i1 orf=474-3680(+)